jgi:hypothetical protein
MDDTEGCQMRSSEAAFYAFSEIMFRTWEPGRFKCALGDPCYAVATANQQHR